jgi:hypothetical protein
MKSPSSMRNGRFHTPKYRGKVQKMEVLYIHSSKMPINKQPQNLQKKKKKKRKSGEQSDKAATN